MYGFAQHEWGDEVLGQTTIFRPGSTVEIIVRSTQPALDFDQLEISHVVVGLYRGVLQMVNRAGWFEGVIIMTLAGRQVGTMTIQKMHAGNSLDSNLSLDASAEKAATARSLKGRAIVQGSYTDAQDRRFQLKWEYGDSPFGLMDQKTIFTAVLGGLADAAVHSPQDSILQINAVGASAGEGPSAYRCVFRIGISIGQPPMMYALVTRTLRDIAGYLMVEQDRFGDLNTDILYDGRKVAHALVSKTGPS